MGSNAFVSGSSAGSSVLNAFKTPAIKSEIEAACLVFKLILKLVFRSCMAPDI